MTHCNSFIFVSSLSTIDICLTAIGLLPVLSHIRNWIRRYSRAVMGTTALKNRIQFK